MKEPVDMWHKKRSRIVLTEDTNGSKGKEGVHEAIPEKENVGIRVCADETGLALCLWSFWAAHFRQMRLMVRSILFCEGRKANSGTKANYLGTASGKKKQRFSKRGGKTSLETCITGRELGELFPSIRTERHFKDLEV